LYGPGIGMLDSWVRNQIPDYALPSVTKRLVAAWKFCGIS
jgi:hypothetical protein